MGIYGHMSSRSPLKPDKGGSGDSSSTGVKETSDFMKDLDQELSEFDSQLKTMKEGASSSSSSSSSSASPATSPSKDPPHFTIDTSHTRNT